MIHKARQLLPTPSPAATHLAAAAAAVAAESGAQSSANEHPELPDAPILPEAVLKAVRWRRGLLLLVDTYSVDGRARSWQEQTYLRQWASAVEGAGFVFLRHMTLARSHALAFATAPMSDAELAALRTREPPEMHMKREKREEGWEMGEGARADKAF